MSQHRFPDGVDNLKPLDKTNGTTSESKLDFEKQEAASQLSSKKDARKVQMRVNISSPFVNYFDGQAFSISGENLTGPFDILPKHHNFISLLSPCELIVRQVTEDNSELPVRIRISGGLLHVKADEVIVFLDV
jgi:hypothetical protein